MTDIRREYQINKDVTYFGGPVIYWMNRDQRVRDNWALIKAMELAESRQSPMAVVFCLIPDYPSARNQHFRFMMEGLCEIDLELEYLKIPFFMISGNPVDELSKFIRQVGAGAVVTDFSPLKFNRKMKLELAEVINVPLIEVDAHNIVPCRIASHKEEFAARTIRPKINGLLSQFLVEFPKLKQQRYKWKGHTAHIDWERVINSFGIPNNFYPAGIRAADEALHNFVTGSLNGYNIKRNDPTIDHQSNLSPYLHFGNISAQRCALDAGEAFWADEDIRAFKEELVVRRELAENYCFYNDHYDSVEGAHSWAKKTIEEHRDDSREYIYGYDEFEQAKTHDPLWNAAQKEMAIKGKMHGYMRMYWAKKMLEWTPDVETAFETALSLNDRYSLDGRDPNGYTGVAWSVCGVHDRAWFERPVFGKIRYMNFNGCKSKFKVNKYITSVEQLL
ncbi:deoxyribodipyrimidine photolyase [Denitrovibrio acetiphilus DSM 12809]|uniref:Deoxyribodipyrimidine photo-lyase n=1 Tax=Denitrovibrio acetiphilus (strain DSM 12809 / NBRC 114555 / N2460) TaxID=522772 RepID=D4H6T7_DENA2|nr:deoxyribodipyrimidine photo-lyase [Denitrovibrio acetiphilus]ADD67803.1 deoxyribodipyrimidine photolyase [Denitrovibrio acetiphilus DSM 12809]